MEKTFSNIRFKQRYDTESSWASKNPVLLAGELAFSSDKDGAFKIGDGKTAWVSLPYASGSYTNWSNIQNAPTKLSQFTNDSGFITGITKAMVTTALGYTPSSSDTWIALKGATTSAAGTAGYAPAPSAGAANRYLRSDGTWTVPPDTNTTYSKLSQFTNDTKYITENDLTSTMITAALGYTPPKSDTNTWTALKGATASTSGTAGYAPAPKAGENTKFLRGDGTWATIEGSDGTAKYIRGGTVDADRISIIPREVGLVSSAIGGFPIFYDNGTNRYQIIRTNAETFSDALSVKKIYPTSVRPTSANIETKGDGAISTFLATSSMTTGKPSADGHIINLAWDNTSGWDAQLFVPNGNTKRMAFRGMSSNKWNSWRELANVEEFVVTEASGFTIDSAYANTSYVIGKMVFIQTLIRGTIKAKQFVTIGTIPEKYAPNWPTPLVIQVSGNNAGNTDGRMAGQVTADGELRVYQYGSKDATAVHFQIFYATNI